MICSLICLYSWVEWPIQNLSNAANARLPWLTAQNSKWVRCARPLRSTVKYMTVERAVWNCTIRRNIIALENTTLFYVSFCKGRSLHRSSLNSDEKFLFSKKCSQSNLRKNRSISIFKFYQKVSLSFNSYIKMFLTEYEVVSFEKMFEVKGGANFNAL